MILSGEAFLTLKGNKNFEFRSSSYYIADKLILTPTEKTQYESILNQIENQPKSIKLNKKVYLGKLSNLPRHKVKEYFKDNKLEKTSRLNYSESIILNGEYINKLKKLLISNNSNYWGVKEVNFYYIKNLTDLKYVSDRLHSYNDLDHWKNKLNRSFKRDGQVIIEVDLDTLSKNPLHYTFLNSLEKQTVFTQNLYRSNDIIELTTYIDHIIKNPNVNVVLDEHLIETLNSDGIELDDEYIATLNSMFESKSQDNINVALEMLSNVNIEKNSLQVALLLNKHMNLFTWGSGLSINNNNSFKSINKYFLANDIKFDADWKVFITKLSKLHKDDPEKMLIINDYVKQNLNKFLKEFYGWDKGFLEISNIDLALIG